MKIIGKENCSQFLAQLTSNYKREERKSIFEYNGQKYEIKFDSASPPFGKYFFPNLDGDILMFITKKMPRAHKREHKVLPEKKGMFNIFVISLIDIHPQGQRVFGHLVTCSSKLVYAPFTFKYEDQILAIIKDEVLTEEELKKIKEEL